jgi:hypothetical protein
MDGMRTSSLWFSLMLGIASIGSVAAAILLTTLSSWPGRGQIEVLPQHLKAGEVNELALKLHNPLIASVWVCQNRALVWGTDPAEEQELRVHRHWDGSAYINFIPMKAGRIDLEIGRWPNPSFFTGTADATLQAEPSTRKPVELRIDANGSALDQNWIQLGLDGPSPYGEGATKTLYPQACYPDLRRPVDIDWRYVQFSVRQPAGAPVIALDKSSGAITALHVGDALVETAFSGAVKQTCIHVRKTGEPADFGECWQLRSRAAGPLNTTWSQDPDGFGDGNCLSDFDTGGLEVTAPDHPVELGQPLEIPVRISRGKLTRLAFNQKRSGVDDASLPYIVVTGTAEKNCHANEGAACILRDEGSSKVIEIVPLALGEEKVAIGASFDDRGPAEKYFRMRVVPTAKGLERIQLDDRPGPDGLRHLYAMAKYEHLEGYVGPLQMEDLKLTVEQPADAPVLRVDPDGVEHDIGNGDATIVAEYGGVKGRLGMRIWLRGQPKPDPAALKP